ncbi:class I SAM-dependent methyltransferase [Thiomonas sp. FB-Cd]|uniref:class I SAM-dependent methyltransferase n=1 Tax=Thiomonas sp. FB-Cd TaxID=1158292 RepID=UPI0009DF0EE7|nr:class I SAM-dependent methyltransferase [Thiomonas sp. FB-Cd]
MTALSQTPAHHQHNPDLLNLIPGRAEKLIEIGCSYGALAREFKKVNPGCHYVGVDIEDFYTNVAKQHCDECITMDLEVAPNSFWTNYSDRDCWIFGDTLEHFRDPWRILSQIAATMPRNGSIVACIPNAQHWSIQARLSVGDFRYADSGLLDKTHLRWFTRQTMLELFASAGFKVVEGRPRIFPEPRRDDFLPVIEEMARIAGVDPQIAVSDAMPLQYVMRAVLA